MVAMGSLESGTSEGHCLTERNSDRLGKRLRGAMIQRYGDPFHIKSWSIHGVRCVVGEEARTSRLQ